ncbi:hypothetical protein Nepgr_024758 [Nepenthes gracilis]|uniref:Uncharacterized protein n=1 Tax=Nepenthes gracilis TaxID=150966 RepID=A0AAD3T4Q4_NEPGR|nr:hypothetical protein Nepgr_024758 [Nepenthes gracilis]
MPVICSIEKSRGESTLCTVSDANNQSNEFLTTDSIESGGGIPVSDRLSCLGTRKANDDSRKERTSAPSSNQGQYDPGPGINKSALWITGNFELPSEVGTVVVVKKSTKVALYFAATIDNPENGLHFSNCAVQENCNFSCTILDPTTDKPCSLSTDSS